MKNYTQFNSLSLLVYGTSLVIFSSVVPVQFPEKIMNLGNTLVTAGLTLMYNGSEKNND